MLFHHSVLSSHVMYDLMNRTWFSALNVSRICNMQCCFDLAFDSHNGY